MKKSTYEPSPIEIWQQCSNIQATWTREEELKRRGAGKIVWVPPGCKRALQLDASSRLKSE
jgi:hypothetical protein